MERKVWLGVPRGGNQDLEPHDLVYGISSIVRHFISPGERLDPRILGCGMLFVESNSGSIAYCRKYF